MRSKASRARKLRLEAAKRLIEHKHLPAEKTYPLPAPPKKEAVRRMVRPIEVAVKVVPA